MYNIPLPHHLQQLLSYGVWIVMVLILLSVAPKYLKTNKALMNSAELSIIQRIPIKAFSFLMVAKYRNKHSRAYHLMQMTAFYTISVALYRCGIFILISVPFALLQQSALPLTAILSLFALGTTFLLLAEWGKRIGDAERKALRQLLRNS